MDLQFLRDLTAVPGPYATVYLDDSHDTEDADRLHELRWAEARRQLEGAGADATTLEALDAAAATAPRVGGRAGRVLVAAGTGPPGERVRLDRTLPEPPATPSATWAPVPDLLPMLVEQPEHVPAVAVRVDETGGEVFRSQPGHAPAEVEQVRGDELVHKVRGGGWSHLAMQERVEESWRRNAADLAERVDKLVAATGARVVVVTGDARSRSRLIDALGSRAAELAVQVERSGGPVDVDELTAAVDEAARDVVVADRRALVDRYEKATGRADGLAVEGVDGVLAALRSGAVDTVLLDTVLLDGGVRRDRTVCVADEPTHVATTPDQLRALGSEPTGEAAVDAALTRAAAASGAALVPFPPDDDGRPTGPSMADGVAALLRYPVPSGA
jgi:hypothetical protein